MAQFTDLPNEILDDIIRCVRDSSTFEELLNLNLTCKALHRLVRPIQRQHAILLWRLNKSAPIGRYLQAHTGDADIRALRLRPQKGVLNAFMVQMSIANFHVQPLCQFLSSLPNLATFSLSMDNDVERQCHMPGSVLAKIINALPPSLIDLEIDTEAVDRIAEEKITRRADEEHLCVAISNCIPRLHSLYLRVSCICPALFRSLKPSPDGQPKSALRRGFIRFDNSPGKEHRLGISTLVGDCGTAKFDRMNEALEKNKAVSIFKQLLDIQKAGGFPNLERFLLYCWEYKMIENSHFRDLFPIRDVASRTITRYPVYHAKETWEWRLPELMDKDQETFYMIRGHDGKDFYEDRDEIEPALLHDILWEEAPNGIRFPPQDLVPHPEPRLHTPKLIDAEYLHRRQDEMDTDDDIDEKEPRKDGESPAMSVSDYRKLMGLGPKKKVQTPLDQRDVIVERL